MSLDIASLNSGSNGNCYYVGNEREAVLVDAGLSCKETLRRMERMGLSMSRVRAIFISHEHDDHILGAEVLSARYQLPVYLTGGTNNHLRLPLDPTLTRPLLPGVPVAVGELTVTAFPKSHDASDPCSFVVASSSVRVGVFTDIGAVCENVIHHFMQCHAVFLEANYDTAMLEEGRYPWPLKNRIRGGQGHLSNHEALKLFITYRPAYMSHLLLAHLSHDNNRPELVQSLFEGEAKGTKIVVASRFRETDIYTIDGSFLGEAGPLWNPLGAVAALPPAPVRRIRRRTIIPSAQLDLFNQDSC